MIYTAFLVLFYALARLFIFYIYGLSEQKGKANFLDWVGFWTAIFSAVLPLLFLKYATVRPGIAYVLVACIGFFYFSMFMKHRIYTR